MGSADRRDVIVLRDTGVGIGATVSRSDKQALALSGIFLKDGFICRGISQSPGNADLFADVLRCHGVEDVCVYTAYVNAHLAQTRGHADSLNNVQHLLGVGAVIRLGSSIQNYVVDGDAV